MLIQSPVSDLPMAIAYEVERLIVVIMADRFLVVQDNEDILYNFPTLAEANRTLAELPIERLDYLRQRAIRSLSMHN